MPRITFATVAAVITALAGAVGTVIVPIWGDQLATTVQAILQALAGILLALPAVASVHVASYQAKARVDAQADKAAQ